MKEFTKLNVGCGADLRPKPWLNLDKYIPAGAPIPGQHGVLFHDLEDINQIGYITGLRPIELENHFEELYMSHVLEHLSHPLRAMQKLWHVAKPGARIEIRVPYGSSDNAWEDPTHVRPYFLESWLYFSQAAYARADYGYRGDWRIVERRLVISEKSPLLEYRHDLETCIDLIKTGRNLVEEMVAILECVKPIRSPKEAKEAAPIIFEMPQEVVWPSRSLDS